MKKTIMLCGILSGMFNLGAGLNPKAEAYFRVTDDLPKLKTGIVLWYNGVFSVTNTGDVAFVVVTDKECAGETFRFYLEGTEEQQRVEEEIGRAKSRREAERKEAIDYFYLCMEHNKETATLQPGEGISFECRSVFQRPLGSPGTLYKAEMYLGYNTWVPVHITPTLGALHPVTWGKDGKPTGDFYYAQMGTNQYLYVKMEDKFKRVGEIKLNSTPLKEEGEDAVTFELPNGAKRKLSRDQAQKIVRDREQQDRQK